MPSTNGHPSSNGQSRAAGPLTVYDLWRPSDRRGQLRRTPALTWGALQVVWGASRRHLLFALGLQFAAGAALALQLLAAKTVLEELVTISSTAGDLSSLLPEFSVLIAALVCVGALAAVMAQQQRLLSELVAAATFDRIIKVGTSVGFDAFEDPAFFDQLQRARTSASYRTVAMVESVMTLTTGLLTSAGIAVALLTIEPLLLPLITAAGIPLLVATIRNSSEAYTFEYAMTPQSRERVYLMELLTERDTAKEVRAFAAGPFLGRRYDALTEERLALLREFLRGASAWRWSAPSPPRSVRASRSARSPGCSRAATSTSRRP